VGRKGLSWSPALATMEVNPKAAPFFVFHMELWFARLMNLYTRSGWFISLAREQSSLYVVIPAPVGVEPISPSKSSVPSFTFTEAVWAVKVDTKVDTKSDLVLGSPSSKTSPIPLEAHSWVNSGYNY